MSEKHYGRDSERCTGIPGAGNGRETAYVQAWAVGYAKIPRYDGSVVLNYAQALSQVVETHQESRLHPHCSAERGDLFSAVDGSSAELEVLNFLNALVLLFKPDHALETGTGGGQGTVAIASAMQWNQFGHLHTVEIDQSQMARAGQVLTTLDPSLCERVTFHLRDSREMIASWDGPPFDFAFFDSLIAFRHEEFELLMQRGKLAPGAVCVFHDTSRERGQTFGDFNPEMIAALDRHSMGRQWMESGLSRGVRMLRV